MATVATNDRIFPTRLRGELREDMLTSFRVGARKLVDPRTGQPFTDAEIAAATAKQSPKYIEADGLDLVLQLEQARALWLADQVQQNRASTKFLTDFHGPTWGLSYLPASGGSGDVTAPCAPGSTFLGSTTLGSATAAVARDQAGKSYQVLYTATSALDGSPATLTLAALDGGEDTNLAVNAELQWSLNAPIGVQGPAKVATQFLGGTSKETDAQFVRRLQRRIRHKGGSGNRGELCAWAEAYSNALDVAFAYSSILYAGTGLIVPLLKRASNVRGPNGRIPGLALLAQLTAYLVPPASPVVPDLGLLWVAPPVATSTDFVISLAMPTGTDAGYADPNPWPVQAGGIAVSITALTNQTHFQIQCNTGLPLGVTAPKMMVWNIDDSSFEQLNVTSVTLSGGITYDVVLGSAPSATLSVGAFLSPYSALADTTADTVQTYFDDLGPGEVVDVSGTSIDPRRARGYRFIVPNEAYPSRAGAKVISYLEEALVGSFVDGKLESASMETPTVPTDPLDGPGLLVAGKVMLSPL